MRDALRRHPWLTLAFGAASLVALAFLIAALVGLAGWRDRPPEAVAGWMTLRYVARAHDVDPRDIDRLAAFGLTEGEGPYTLDRIAADRGVPVAEVIAAVEAAIGSLQAEEGAGP
jgi:hypothetical protein